MQEYKFLKLPSFIYLIVLPALLFIPFLGNVHLFDWDEINFAEISREMVLTGNYSEPQINFQTFTEKPPLFFWLQAAAMNIFGINEFSARLPNALLGILAICVLYAIGKKLKNKFFGFLWALVYAGTILPHLYFKSGIIDPWFNFFIFLSLYGLITAEVNKKENKNFLPWLISGGVFLGLAILTKGPAALLIAGLALGVYWISKRFRWFISFPHLLLFVVVALFTAALWLGINFLQRGEQFIREFTVRQWEMLTTPDAGHEGFFFYHFVVIFFGCFPATAFFIRGLIQKNIDEGSFSIFKKWMGILFFTVLILFTVVTTKIVHYSSLCYYPLSFIAAAGCYHLIQNNIRPPLWLKTILIISALPFIILPFAFAWAGQNIERIKPLFKKDAFAFENLQADVHWSGWEFLPGLCLLIGLILTFIHFNKQKNKTAIIVLFVSSIIYLQTTLFFLIGRIEGYSQNANIEFWKAHANEDCYMTSFNYKTYTHYFYGKAKKQPNKNYIDREWLLKGTIDKPVYISCRIQQKQDLEKELPDAKFLYNKNGFYFYKREVHLR